MLVHFALMQFPGAPRYRHHVGARDYLAFAAQWLAYALPYRRFAVILADANARLGADAVCYSFIVVNLHHLHFAGFYRRTRIQERAKAKGVRMGRKPKLTDHQKREAIKRRDHGEETLAEIGRSYNVSGWTIGRLAP